jgi:hypothetical protein
MAFPKRIRHVCKAAESLGLEVLDVGISGGSHIKLKLRRGEVTKTTFVAFSSGDRRSLLNWKSDMRRAFGTQRE